MMAWLRAAPTAPGRTSHDGTELGRRSRRVVSPIIGRDGLGRAIDSARRNSPGVSETSLASRGAAACAVVMAREHAAAVATGEPELNVLDWILDGALRSEGIADRKAKRLDMTSMRGTWRWSPTGQARRAHHHWSASMRPHLRRDTGTKTGPVLWRTETITLNDLAGRRPDEAATVSADCSRISSAGPDRLYAGLMESPAVKAGPRGSGVVPGSTTGPDHWQRLHGPGKITNFESLGIYRLLFAARDLPG